jgi:hypothetical protein
MSVRERHLRAIQAPGRNLGIGGSCSDRVSPAKISDRDCAIGGDLAGLDVDIRHCPNLS